jgi:nitrite reductase (NO-forming)
MSRWLRQRSGEFYILIIGLLMLTGFVFAAVYQPRPPATSTSATSPSETNGPAQQQNASMSASVPAPSPSPAQQKANPAPPPQTAQAQPAPAAPAEPVKPAAEPPKPATPAPRSGEPAHDMKAMSSGEQPSEPARAAQTTPSPQAAANTSLSGDPVAGRQVFRKCQACHSLEPGKNLLGPSLAGIVGRKAAAEPAYNYSPALKQANITWNAKTLDAYLADPAKTIPGNKMPFPGLKTEHDRGDVIAFLMGAGGAQASAAAGGSAQPRTPAPPAQQAQAPAASPPSAQAPAASPQPPQGPSGADIGYIPDAKYTLRSGIAEGRMVFMGVGGAIEGKVNPVLTAAQGQVVQLTLINGEGAEHDIVFPDQDAKSPRVTGKGSSTTIAFRATKSGDFTYYCSVPGHQLAGMLGQFIVTPRPPPQTLVEADISREPNDLPPPIGKREPRTVRVDLFSAEMEGRLAEGTTFGYWTFNGKVPGPFIRVRVGDTIDIHLKNSADSAMIHSVDFHAATGPGGGAAALQVDPGQEKSMTWKALIPGLYVYHCATPMVAEHIANGMYGMILVEPEGGLPPVDREFYVMQGEIYTDVPYGQHGSAEFSVEKLLNERPEYFVFNGSVGALSKLHPLEAKVGETVRIFFGVGGPNYTSSFHVIGEIFDRVYALGGVASPPLEGIQTVTVPAGGAVIAEFKLDVPGNYTLVDHALARAERGLVGILHVEGPPNPDIYNGQTMPGMGH